MSDPTDTKPTDRPLQPGELLKHYQGMIDEKKTPKIGIEVEKIGIVNQTGENANYTGKGGYLAILGKLYEELGWEIIKKQDKFILSMQRGQEHLHLESDGRIELAGSPHESIHDLAREFRIHQNEVSEISDIFGIGWLGIGYHPVSKNVDIEDIPVYRKQLLAQHFRNIKEKTGNDFGLAWYKKTAGIHVNIDYISEQDMARKAKVFYRLAPVLTAMFANSPFSKKEFTGYMSYRGHITLESDVPQFAIPRELYESDFSFEAWLNHLMDMPLLFLEKDGEWMKPGIPFQQYLAEGYNGHQATMKDFELHTKSAWKDVKIKNVLEIRCIDSLPPHLVPAVAALIKGLSCSDTTLKKLEEMVASWTYHDYLNLQGNAFKHGLQATIQGKKLLNIAKELLEIAESGLKENRIRDAYERDESRFLQPIKEFIFVKERSPAEWLVEKWEGEWGRSFFPVFKWCQY